MMSLTELLISFRIPEDIFVTVLKPWHAQMVYDHWPFKRTTSVKIITEEIATFPSAGVFLKNSGELVSWMMYLPTNEMGRLHTMNLYRRKGYAKLVILFLSKLVVQAGFVPTANVNVANGASLQLFKSLGFQLLQPWYNCHLSH